MSRKLFCCLCYMPAINDYKHLQNDSAEYNDFYNITIQYFSPKLLTEHICVKQSTARSVLCGICWTHIQDFHAFQETVLKSRTSLYNINIKDYNHKIDEAITSTLSVNNDQVNTTSNSDNSDSEVEVQYVLAMDDSDDCDNETTSLEQINTHKSSLQISTDVSSNDSFDKRKRSLECTSTLSTRKTNLPGNAEINLNSCSNEEITSFERISMPNSPMHIKVEEFQYSSVCNNETTKILKSPLPIKVEEFQYSSVCNNETTKMPKSPLHIKVEESQYSSVCNNETTKIPKSPLHIKIEDENDTTVCRGENSVFGNVASNLIQPVNTQEPPIHFGNETWTSLEQIFIRKSPLHIKVEDDICRDTELQQNESDLDDSIDMGQNIEMNNIDGYDEKPLYKSKTFRRGSKHLFCSDDDVGDDEAIKSNKFLTEYKSKSECDICGEACANKLLKVNFKKKENSTTYDKCFDRYYYICGKLNSCKQTIIHEKLQEFKCNNCPKAFKKRHLLKRHLATHATKKKLRCEKCRKTYFSENRLKKHIATAHACNKCDIILKSPLACSNCGKVSPSRKCL